MHHPQIIVYESNSILTRKLKPLGKAQRWPVREERRLESCLDLLRQGKPSVLVLKLGRDLVAELRVLERVHWLCPNAATVVLEDRARPALAELAWDLGAGYVLFPPQSEDQLQAIVAGLMREVIEKMQPGNETRAGSLTTAGMDPRAEG